MPRWYPPRSPRVRPLGLGRARTIIKMRNSSLHRVTNRSRGTTVGHRIRVARSSLQRTVGLLRTPNLDSGEGLWIERSPSIHMFFMPYAIDAVFVAADGRVTKVVENLRPWRVVWWARGARDCLELPVGAVAASRTEVGDRLELEAAN
jgi:uncharacterized membrane protein (UPF0127 family)